MKSSLVINDHLADFTFLANREHLTAHDGSNFRELYNIVVTVVNSNNVVMGQQHDHMVSTFNTFMMLSSKEIINISYLFFNECVLVIPDIISHCNKYFFRLSSLL